MTKLLMQQVYLSTRAEKAWVENLKEELGFVAINFDAAMTKDYGEACTLPDMNVIVIDKERFKCPELLFRPSLDYQEGGGIHELVSESIMQSLPDIRKGLFANIVLAGGSTMFQGLPERLEQEIVRLAPSDVKVRVVAPPDRKYAAWIGGSILASLATFPAMAITQEVYNDAGPGVVNHRCW
jgi:actin